MKKSLAILSVLIISAISFSGCNSFTNKTYENKELGVKFQYPNAWTVEDENNTHVYLNPNDGTTELLSVSKQKNTSSETDIAKWYEEEAFPNPFSEWEQTKVGGLPALRKEAFTMVLDNQQRFLIENGVGMERGLIDVNSYNMVVDSIEFTK